MSRSHSSLSSSISHDLLAIAVFSFQKKKKKEGPRVCIENGGHLGHARSLKQEE